MHRPPRTGGGLVDKGARPRLILFREAAAVGRSRSPRTGPEGALV